jgi:hypothetical protein
MKNSHSTSLAISLSLGLSLSACASTPKPTTEAASCPIKPTASASTAPKLPIYPEQAQKPKNEEEFYANLLSCEANANAHVGYLRSLQLRTKSTTLNLSGLPCNLVRDIHDNLTRIADRCAAVTEPESLYFEANPADKSNRSRLSAEAQEIADTARQTSKKIRNVEKRCFPEDQNLTSL